MGEGLVVESAVEASSSIGGNRAEEAFFDGDADRATDRYLAAVKEGLEGVLGVEKAASVVRRASGGETAHRRQHKGERRGGWLRGGTCWLST